MILFVKYNTEELKLLRAARTCKKRITEKQLLLTA